jgi:hypothetical protein
VKAPARAFPKTGVSRPDPAREGSAKGIL